MGHNRSCKLSCPQVFLSHSRKQKNFARHLFKEMQRENICCFFDKDPQSLRIGEEFPSRIFDAAMNCKVAVVVLSEEFISTKWPMQELCALVKAQNTNNTLLQILPLFFAMSPDALAEKLQNKGLLKSWQELRISERRPLNFDEWIKALEALRRINGVKYIESEDEVAYIDKVVAHIRDILPPRLIYDESDVQGKERLCQEVAKLFDRIPCPENGVKIAGLYGVGGVGKTTIAKILCNFYSKRFDGKVLHVELGREKSMESLKSALRSLCCASESLVNSVRSIEHGWYLLEEMMYGRSVFLALDNISDVLECTEEVLMYLRAVCHGNRSTILLTARSLSILEQFIQEGDRSCMPVPFLQEEEAIAVLLKLTPLKLSNLTADQMDIARKCLQKCCFSGQYHPLALKIFGKFLHVKLLNSWAGPSRWIDVPNISQRDQMQEVFSIFKGSFMGLSLRHRKIFMLLSLYLPHPCMPLEKAIDWLAVVCGEEVGDMESAINELKGKGFIESAKESRDSFYIHDLLIAFAESEADGTGKWIYLKGKDGIPSNLQEALSNDRPRFSAMKVENCHFQSPGMINNKLFTHILVLHLKDMLTLKVLDLSSMKIVRSITIIGCPGLKEIHGLESLTSLAYFVIRDCSADVHLCPGIQCLRALRHLEVNADLQETTIKSLLGPWSLFPPLQDMSNVGTIRLDHIEKTPGPLHLGGCSKLRTIELYDRDITLLDLTGCVELRTVKVRYCYNLSEIRLSNAGCSATNFLPMPGCANFGGLLELPSVSGLPNLRILILGDMGSLRELCSLSGLSNLSELILEGMSNLRELPSLSGLPNLSLLRLEGMSNLRELSSFSGLPNLNGLSLEGMSNLRELPSLSGLPNLSWLILEGMSNLRELSSLRGLPNLSELSLEGMSNLRELPSLSGLPNLSELILEGMSNLRELPSLSRLPNLSLLRLEGMSNLRELPSLSGLPNLSGLSLEGMSNLRELPSLSRLSNLSWLILEGMSNLRELSSLSGLPNLSELSLEGMSNWRKLPSFSGLPNLSLLRLEGMSNLRELPSLSGLPNLSGLRLEGMSNLMELPNVSGLPNLSGLRLEGMSNLMELPSLSRLPNLSWLRLEGMSNLRELPSLSGLPNLSGLRLEGMSNLMKLPSLGRLSNLSVLELLGMGNLRELPSLSGLPNLSLLRLEGMSNLRELPSFSGLPNLSGLRLEGMSNLMELPSLSRLSNLRGLRLEGMSNLMELPSLSGLSNLSWLRLQDMSNLRELPSLSGLPNLSLLRLGGMSNLRELPSLSGLPNLKSLTLKGMSNLRELPSLSGLPNLSWLTLEDMRNLREELTSLTSGLPNLRVIELLENGNLRE